MNIKHQKNNKTIKFSIIILIVGSFLSIGSYFGVSYFIDNNSEKYIADKKTETESIIRSIFERKEAKKKEPVYINLPNADPVRAKVEDYTKDDSIWKLVNKTSPLPVDYSPVPISVPNILVRSDKSTSEMSLRNDIHTELKEMFDAAKNDGIDLMLGSGYRSASLQATYFYNLAASIGDLAANQAIARPGESEHQTALAIDVTTKNQECYLNECFESTSGGVWMADNSYKYGFILRYMKDKVDITGYQYEPWHFRYVGKELSAAIYNSGLSYEEVWPYLMTALDTLRDNGAL